MACTVLWLRQDLRLEDNSVLAAAIARGKPIVPVFIWAPQEEQKWPPGGATKWWLHHALADLRDQLEATGLKLILRDARGTSSLEVLLDVVDQGNADAVYWNRRHEPFAASRDAKVQRALEAKGIRAESHESSLLFSPEAVANKAGKPFQVFTPMWKHIQTLTVPAPKRVDLGAAKSPRAWPASLELAELDLLPSVAWDSGIKQRWGTPSRDAAIKRLRKFVHHDAPSYLERRDFPSEDATTALSPFLHFGQIGVREIWHTLDKASEEAPAIHAGVMRQIIWREFAYHLLHHYPWTPERPLREHFDLFPWEEDHAALRRWQQGETGYPIVDAGLRQLWQSGWMHNRVRMIVGSFLVKHLLQHWIEGARWFWDTLVDADLANNTLGWQWVGGCGADAAPYFRVFNPIKQGEKFDPQGKYVTRWVPELKNVPAKFIHQPWALGELELRGMGVILGKNYPARLIGHTEGRTRALEAFQSLKNGSAA